MSEDSSYFTIKSISEWNNNTAASKIILPKMQRGFVWKPDQMSNLWDSILRGFPIGSFLMAINHDNNTKDLLDGQQRSTSVLTGFYNQFSDKNNGVFSLKRYPSIWIDIHPIEIPDDSEFSVHVVTQSHPWGFNGKNKGGGLSMNDRRNALSNYESLADFSNYLEIPSENLVPWDSSCPIPLCFILELINVDDIQEFKQALLLKLNSLTVTTKHEKCIDYGSKLRPDDFEKLFDGLLHVRRLVIPELLIDIESISSKKDNSQDPTLFVRLNAGGTKISGEELIYSIFKAHFPECKELVEQISADYIAPSKLINIFAKLAQVIIQNEANKHITYIKSVDLGIFRRLLQDADYKATLSSLIRNKSNAKIKFDLCLELFDISSDQVPIVLIKQVLATNTDIFYIIMSYFEIHKIFKSDQISNSTKKYLVGIIFYISWFCIDKNRAISRLFQLLINDDTDQEGNIVEHWKKSIKILVEENLVFPLLLPDISDAIFSVIIKNCLDFRSSEFIEKCREVKGIEEYYDLNEEIEVDKLRNFIERTRFTKELVLFAQNSYIISEFEEFNQYQLVEDTNRPWDWDHIYPNSWVYYRKDIHHLVKQWVNSNGNFRALSIGMNRSENNRISPTDRLKDLEVRKNCFIDTNDYDKYWSVFSHNDLRITENDTLLSCYLNAVVGRTCKIYNNWFEAYFK